MRSNLLRATMGKKEIRSAFRKAVLKRDGFRCVWCNVPGKCRQTGEYEGNVNPATVTEVLDAHHITDRNEMPNGGYVVENGASLCSVCHENAEQFHSTGVAVPGFAPDDLYQIINSCHEKAVKASEKL